MCVCVCVCVCVCGTKQCTIHRLMAASLHSLKLLKQFVWLTIEWPSYQKSVQQYCGKNVRNKTDITKPTIKKENLY